MVEKIMKKDYYQLIIYHINVEMMTLCLLILKHVRYVLVRQLFELKIFKFKLKIIFYFLIIQISAHTQLAV